MAGSTPRTLHPLALKNPKQDPSFEPMSTTKDEWFNEKLDVSRNESFMQVFPEYAEWYQKI